MQKFTFKVLNEQGIHARPSTQISILANKFSGNVKIIFDNEFYDAKNVMEIMLIGLEMGNVFEIEVDGKNFEEEIKILEELKELIEVKQFK